MKLTLSVLLLLLFLPTAMAVNDQPVAKASVNPNLCFACECQSITLDASGSYDPDGQVVKYEWYYGDQLVAEGIRATLGKPFITNPDTYKITLKIIDNGGMSDTEEVVFYVKNNPVPYIEKLKNRTNSNYDYLVIGDKISVEVILSDKDYGTITYNWDYDSEIFRKTGDKGKITFKVISSKAKSNHEIGVIASNLCGDESNRKEIEVKIKSSSSNSPPKSEIILPVQIYEGKRFQIKSGSTTGQRGDEEDDEIVSWNWKISKITNRGEEEITTSSRKYISFTVENSGELYNVSLEVTDRFGEKGIAWQNFHAKEVEPDPPIADASATEKIAIYGKEFTLDGSRSWDPDGNILREVISSYLWYDLTYGEYLGSSNSPTFNVMFNRTGLHEIELTVIDTGFSEDSESLSDKDVIVVNVIEEAITISTPAPTSTLVSIPPKAQPTCAPTCFYLPESQIIPTPETPGMGFGLAAIATLIIAIAVRRKNKH
ncbi:MAG: PKD domain-containing protein [Candidatus Pacebacteria bacterium]|nr:PKD domain-containing protein [Candidatus Paceibacterota bacterium]